MRHDRSENCANQVDWTSRRRVGGGAALGVIVELIALLVCAPRPAAAQDVPRAITLITGDRVVVSGANSEGVSIRRGSGREDVAFVSQRVAVQPGQPPHLFVIPEDASALIAAGRLDRRLFDVTLLLEFEYDDAHRDSLPLIITYAQPGGAAPAARAGSARSATTASAAGAVSEFTATDLPAIHGLSVIPPKTRVQEVWATLLSSAPAAAPSARARAAAATAPGAGAQIAKIWLDGLLFPVLDRSVGQISAPAAWELGYEGDGIVVAVLDTGVDDTHPDLSGKVLVARNFTEESDRDEVGHGTHVASIIAGSGAAQGGLYRGVAPGVQLLSGKVCLVFGCPESSLIAGMEWAVEGGAQVINMSISGRDLPGLDPLEEAVAALSAQYGALFVIASGNAGPSLQSIGSPGSADAALTVGAVDRDDSIAWFSGRGMRVGDYAIKPDVTAPGVDIVAARAAGTELGLLVGEYYTALSGTSMATPHAAGAAALIMRQHPDWGPAEIKHALIGSAAFNPSLTVLDQGAGRIDLVAALDTSLSVDTPSLSFGLARWPHGDDEVITRTLTFRNLGPTTELALDLDIVGPGGVRAPSQMFTVSAANLALPEGGVASVTVSANTRIETVDGVYSGRLIASDASGRALAVPIAVNREVESYDFVIRQLDRDGAPAPLALGFIYGLDDGFWQFLERVPGGGDVSMRLPAGRYVLQSVGLDLEGDDPVTLFVAPNQQLQRDTLLVLDARTATPMTPTVPNAQAELFSVDLRWDLVEGSRSVNSSLFMGGATTPSYYSAMVSPAAPNLTSLLAAQWLDSASTPEGLYAAAWPERGKLPEGPTKAVNARKLATVHAHYAAPIVPQAFHGIGVAPYPAGASGYAMPVLSPPLPHQRTEYYYSEDKTLSWIGDLTMNNDDFSQVLILGRVPVSYRPGRSYRSRWNEPPFSPVLPSIDAAWDWAVRVGDALWISPPNYGDREGHAGFITHQGRAVLYRNGEKIAESELGAGGIFDVPPERSRYRLLLEATQTMFSLTTREQTVWTFQSAHVADDQTARLSLLTVRFQPALNELGQAPRSSRFCLPFQVGQYGGAGAPVGNPTVEASYDDGASWTPATVVRTGHSWSAFVDHPRTAEFVSLRATTRDRQGNSVEQTLIRAYALAK